MIQGNALQQCGENQRFRADNFIETCELDPCYESHGHGHLLKTGVGGILNVDEKLMRVRKALKYIDFYDFLYFAIFVMQFAFILSLQHV